ncbi:hypothetical protein HBI56_158490 [Parastagonospora nodorum]|uniref:Uncharacterized protein n=1 Tax=Phaeosphaeria nodorum (strain SN15 / ATCC MYA-4574 / FGSC 10173) TaxID=321614 RepID=A0A7U2HUG9_PHANO|nr:hypothetical protein HBH56_189210 [Parastagonospora nodorum]QRC92310.1 hypothetical protein JI435_402220 [Parastagonospora nodorum SN15]KAH3925045.1 hypothetical protein HBH54_185020 [Parastagonospora nodorum]KAH3954362.1 hypothetical protein HBH53_024370 [Parastagonospora nodorum]KAH3963772.1 hypothetical protein HBH51_164210 [Parastagonospora nodorum]
MKCLGIVLSSFRDDFLLLHYTAVSCLLRHLALPCGHQTCSTQSPSFLTSPWVLRHPSERHIVHRLIDAR